MFISKSLCYFFLLIFILLIIAGIIIKCTKLLFFLPINKRKLRHPYDIFSPHRTYIESHRGANREIFQNTLESISRVIQYDIDSFECDAWLTKDNVLVIVHGGYGGDLKGFYNRPGKVPQLTWDKLSTYRTIRDNLKMPRLIDIMELAKNKIFLNLEIKDPRVDLVFPLVIELIEKYNFFDQISISSLHHLYYNKIEEYNKSHKNKIVFGFVYNPNRKKLFDYTKKGHTLNIFWKEVTKEVCDKAHKNGMAVIAWFSFYITEKTEMYEKLIKSGVDGIICNTPLLAKKVIDNYYLNKSKK